METQSKLHLSGHPLIRIGTLCVMYIAQGITHGFIVTTMASYLTQNGITVKEIAEIMAIAVLPWTFKWIWGPVIDRFQYLAMGRRRPWLLLAQLLMTVTMVSLLFLRDVSESITAIKIIFLVHNIFKSLQDVSVDALAVDVLKEEERGRANGFMYGCSYLGAFAGTGLNFIVAGKIFPGTSFQTAIIIMTVLLLTIMLFPLLLRERPGEKLLPWTKGKAILSKEQAGASSFKQLFGLLLKAFSIRSAILAAITAIMLYIGSNLMGPLAPKLYSNILGFGEDVFTFSVIVSTIGMMLGSMGGGYIADKLGHKRTVAFCVLVLSTFWICTGFLLPLWSSKTYLYISSPLSGFFIGCMAVAFFSIAMDVSWKRVAGSQFSGYMALLNLSIFTSLQLTSPIENLSGKIATSQIFTSTLGKMTCFSDYPDLVPFAIMGFFMAFFNLLVLIPLSYIDPHQTAKVLGDGQPETGPQQE